ncbi:MAG: cytochrome c biogenesis protein CcdA [Parcubacteria group bacterium]
MNITIPLIVGAAAVDSINPCAIAVLVFLIVYLLAMKNRKKMLQIGLIYVFFVFLTYLCAGLGLLSFIQSAHITKFIYYLAAGLSIILGLINVKDAILKNPKPLLAISEARHATLQKYIQKASLPAAIILGILVAMFELPCTGGVYLAILSLLATRETLIQAVFYLIVYNLIFVLPLVAILLAAYYGLSLEKIENWRKGSKRALRLIIGLALVGLGVLMLFL